MIPAVAGVRGGCVVPALRALPGLCLVPAGRAVAEVPALRVVSAIPAIGVITALRALRLAVAPSERATATAPPGALAPRTARPIWIRSPRRTTPLNEARPAITGSRTAATRGRRTLSGPGPALT